VSNTQQRILSALVLIALVLFCFWQGLLSMKLLVLVIGLLMVDELSCNFIGKRRFGRSYNLNQLLFSIPFCLMAFVFPHWLVTAILWLVLGMNFIFLYYLFFYDVDSNSVVNSLKRKPYTVPVFVFFSLVSLLFLLSGDNWRISLLLLLVVNFSMDTGAWLFGKSMGKHKLWEKVSPKKTIEGLIGGIVCSGILGAFVYYKSYEIFAVKYFILFGLLGLVSQIGDLFQSKVKRQFSIKDSSSLIPGHGGVYDRVDSLIFMAPFYILLLGRVV